MFTYVCTVAIDTGLYQCDGCGALVPSPARGLHIDFHDRIARLESANANA